MLEFSTYSLIPIKKTLTTDESFDLSLDLSDDEDLTSLKPGSTYLVSTHPDSPLDQSEESDFEPESPPRVVNLPPFTAIPYCSPCERGTLYAHVVPKEHRYSLSFSSVYAEHSTDLKLDNTDNCAVLNERLKTVSLRLSQPKFGREAVFEGGIVSNSEFTSNQPPSNSSFEPAPSWCETRDEMLGPDQSLEKDQELTMRCTKVLKLLRQRLAAKRLTQAARRFLDKIRKKKAADKFKNFCDEAFKAKWEQFKDKKLKREQQTKRRSLLKAVVQGWRTRRLLKKNPAIRILKEKLKHSLPFATKRLKAKLISTLEHELDQGLKRRPRKSVLSLRKDRPSVNFRSSVKQAPIKPRNSSCSAAFKFLSKSKLPSKLPLQTAPVTPRVKFESSILHRKSSLDEFCMLETLINQETLQQTSKQPQPSPSHTQSTMLRQTSPNKQAKFPSPKLKLSSTLQSAPRLKPTHSRVNSLTPRTLKNPINRRSLSKQPTKLQGTLEAARQLLQSGALGGLRLS
jgi:hypothetical protein